MNLTTVLWELGQSELGHCGEAMKKRTQRNETQRTRTYSRQAGGATGPLLS